MTQYFVIGFDIRYFSVECLHMSTNSFFFLILMPIAYMNLERADVKHRARFLKNKQHTNKEVNERVRIEIVSFCGIRFALDRLY